ncbi:YqaE/Pmp3 family membrane protein [Rhodovibrio sodomensis]|uniref:YqaE/Pmp3 family membrane protein n=1 Tax=Rhodovibrio sodomensis TaxID=1088 RepID=UPI003F58E84D
MNPRGAAARRVLKRPAGVYIYLGMDLVRIILAILLPPLGVFLQVGLGGHFWLNILLTLFGYIPGIVHAVWIIARR